MFVANGQQLACALDARPDGPTRPHAPFIGTVHNGIGFTKCRSFENTVTTRIVKQSPRASHMISSFELIVSTGLRLTQRLALDARLEKFRFAASTLERERGH